MSYRSSKLILDTLQEAMFEQVPRLPDGAYTHYSQPPLGGGQVAANVPEESVKEGRESIVPGEGSNVSAQHPARLHEQPSTEGITWKGGLVPKPKPTNTPSPTPFHSMIQPFLSPSKAATATFCDKAANSALLNLS